MTHTDLSATAWALCRQILTDDKYSGRFEANEWRECFQLLTAALIYSWRGWTGLPAGRAHVQLRPEDTPDAWRTSLREKTAIPDFDDADLVEILAGMHLASASFRVTAALPKAHLIKAHQPISPSPVARLLRVDDWKRGALLPYLKKAATLGCCKLGWGAGTQDEMYAQCCAIALAHRDTFGHGEQGGDGDEWRKQRRKCFTDVYQCRVVEAQLILACLGLTLLVERF